MRADPSGGPSVGLRVASGEWRVASGREVGGNVKSGEPARGKGGTGEKYGSGQVHSSKGILTRARPLQSVVRREVRPKHCRSLVFLTLGPLSSLATPALQSLHSMQAGFYHLKTQPVQQTN